MSEPFRDIGNLVMDGPSNFGGLALALRNVRRTDLDRAKNIVLEAKRKRRTVFFVGNGGSAAIASHMAADFLKAGNVAAMCFNDGALVTCLANDLGYEHVFSKPLSMQATMGDVLFAISSSGKSKSILNAVDAAALANMETITLSGFDAANPLRNRGQVNFHVECAHYGVVEVTHHAICHWILDAVVDAHA